jgi:signal transduction histidine kinase
MKPFIALFCCIILLAGCTQQQPVTQTIPLDKIIARTMVHTTAAGLANLISTAADEAQAIQMIRAYIAPIRFYDDASGYFYVYNFDCINIAHATQPDLQGKNLKEHQDTHGLYVIQELSKAAQSDGGFVEFYWIKPGTTTEHKKLGYVEAIPGTPYFIGTGLYEE